MCSLPVDGGTIPIGFAVLITVAIVIFGGALARKGLFDPPLHPPVELPPFTKSSKKV